MKYKRKPSLKIEPELDVLVLVNKYPFKAIDNIITLGDERQHNIEIGIEPIKLSIKCGKKYLQIGIIVGTLEVYLGSRVN